MTKPSDTRDTESLLVDKEQELMKNQPKIREFTEREPVYVQAGKEKIWEKATVLKRHGASSPVYDLLYKERVIKKHADKIKHRTVPLIQLNKQLIPEEEKQRLRAAMSQSPVERDESRERAVTRAMSQPRGSPERVRDTVQMSAVPEVVTIPDRASESVINVSPSSSNNSAITTSDSVRRSARLASKPQVKYNSQL